MSELYLTTLEYRGWYFCIEQEKQVFGKTKVIAEKDDIEEVFYMATDYLSEAICEEWYTQYLYIYD